MNIISNLIILLLVYGDPSLGFEKETLKVETREGIFKIVRDFENGIVSSVEAGLFHYFPNEIEELASYVHRYFMGKHDGYSRSKVFH